jgi:hypothetical protein
VNCGDHVEGRLVGEVVHIVDDDDARAGTGGECSARTNRPRDAGHVEAPGRGCDRLRVEGFELFERVDHRQKKRRRIVVALVDAQKSERSFIFLSPLANEGRLAVSRRSRNHDEGTIRLYQTLDEQRTTHFA